MPHPIWAVFAAATFAYALTTISKVGSFNQTENKRTRDWQRELTGWRKRAYWAHQNSLEGFPIFATGVLACLVLAPGDSAVPALAWGYIASRVAYSYCYLKDLGRPRTLVWFAGTACSLALFVIAGVAGS
jgi:uncharacterized MAPEG superfamily protein